MNKELSYTSGEWSVEKRIDTKEKGQTTTIESNGFVIAICGKDTWALPKEQQIANATLIRNAPSLYETLKLASILLDRYVFSVHPCDTIHQAEKQLINAVLENTIVKE